jgi:hypothetical protein
MPSVVKQTLSTPASLIVRIGSAREAQADPLRSPKLRNYTKAHSCMSHLKVGIVTEYFMPQLEDAIYRIFVQAS